MVVPLRRRGVLRRAPDPIATPAPGADDGDARSTSTASSGCIRAWRRSQPLFDGRQLAIVHACGSPDPTRSHFDAQDYMETGTPGVKSTRDGWLNRVLQARTRRGRDAVSRRRAGRAVAARAAGQGAARWRWSQLDAFGVAAGADRRWPRVAFEEQYAAAADTVAAQARPRGLRCDEDCCKTADPRSTAPANGADYPPTPFGAGAAAGRAARQGRRRPRGRLRRVGGWDTHVNQGGAAGSARRPAATTSRAALGAFARTSATGWRTWSS